MFVGKFVGFDLDRQMLDLIEGRKYEYFFIKKHVLILVSEANLE